jgi:hypothetical protein
MHALKEDIYWRPGVYAKASAGEKQSRRIEPSQSNIALLVEPLT